MSLTAHAFGWVALTEQLVGNLWNARSHFKWKKDILVHMWKYENAPQNVLRLVWYFPTNTHTPDKLGVS